MAHLLIVDDEPAILAVLSSFFKHTGYTVKTARDGQEAVELAKTLRPDLLILDIQMPIKSGVAVVGELRQLPDFATMPMVGMTAHASAYLPSEVIQAGFTMVLTKPFDLAELQKVVAGLLQRH